MRLTPKDVHREVLRRVRTAYSDEPTWYAIWHGEPHGEKSVQLGRTERLARPRWWRAYPSTGEYPREIRGWTNVIDWFIELQEKHSATE